MSLAKNAVHNKRLLEYADELEYYIYTLDEKNKEEKDKKDDNEAK